MNAKTHAKIVNVTTVIVTIGAILFVGLVFLNQPDSDTLSLYGLAFGVLAILLVTVLSLIPLRCPKPGCNGRMKRDWIEESEDQSRLQYVCRDCGETYNTRLITRRGEPWWPCW